MTDTQLWVIRHGETEWSANGRHTGSTDIPLTSAGREEAEALRPRLADLRFSAVYCSPKRRALDTAELAGLQVTEVLGDLQEWDYGDYEGLTSEQIHEQRPGWTVFADGCPGGEQAPDVGRRADRVIERVRRDSDPVAVVGHSHMLRVLVARWVGLPPNDGQLVILDTGTLTTLGWEHGLPAIRRLNTAA